MAFNPLSILFTQQGLVPPEPTNEILVNASRNRRPEAESPIYNEAEPRPEITPHYIFNDDRIAPTPDEMKEIVPRHGMFGTKGTLRDVLGTLGDAFLVQSGHDQVYAPRRQMEREADAMYGFTDNPMQAIERLAQQNPKAAQDLYNDYLLSQDRAAQVASLEGSRQDQANNRAFDNLTIARNQVARWMSVAGDNPSRIAAVYANAQRLADQYGWELSDLGLTGPNMSPDERAVLAGGDMTVYQQEQLPRRDRQLDISQQNADSARITATRPRNMPRPRSDSDTETAIRIGNIPENQRTQGEANWYREYNERNGSNQGNGRRNVTPPSTGGFRIRSVRPAN